MFAFPPPPPHPTHWLTAAMLKTASKLHPRQRRRGTPRINSSAARVLPPKRKKSLPSRAELAAVVVTVSVVLAAVPEETVTWAGLNEQVGASVAVPVP